MPEKGSTCMESNGIVKSGGWKVKEGMLKKGGV
jgi:hypothetical protein